MSTQNSKVKTAPSNEVKGQKSDRADAFDRLYRRWAEHALGKRRDPPSREVWDSIVLRLLLSEDPVRVRSYRRIEAWGPESLGEDAYELWSMMPDYTANRSVPVKTRKELIAYSEAYIGSMRRLMQAQGLEERYESIMETQRQIQSQIRRGQSRVLTIGCLGISAMIFMFLIVLLIILINLVSR